VLPTAAALAKSSVNGTELSKRPSSTLVSLAAEQGVEVALVGRLVWNDRDGHAMADRPARPIDASFAASRSMKPFGAASVAQRGCCRRMANLEAGNDKTDFRKSP
jgi:hypothetical protein